MQTTRSDGRSFDAPRPITIVHGFQRNPEGSVLYRCGNTTVLVAASIEENVPPWMKGRGVGWVSAEYEMHPRCNPDRQRRSVSKGKLDGRASEIQRLVGRALRAAIDPKALGERTLTIDCDVLDADGGTRTASITGGFVALALALDQLRKRAVLKAPVLRDEIAAISVGMVRDKHLVDLDYQEDSRADVDLNVVATARGGLVEVQGTAEGEPIARADFDRLVDLALGAMPRLFAAQHAALEAAGVEIGALRAR